MRVRIRRFGPLRFPVPADLSAAACSSPIVSFPRFAVLLGFTLPSSESSADVRGHLWNTTEIRSIRSPFRSALRIGAVHVPRSPPLLRPLLTSRSAVTTFPRRHPFRHEARAPQVRSIGCPCTSAGFTVRLFGRESFAVLCPLALSRPACYPVSVRHPTGLATPLLSALPSRSAPCGSLRSLRPTPQRTSTSKSMFMLGTHHCGEAASIAPPVCCKRQLCRLRTSPTEEYTPP